MELFGEWGLDANGDPLPLTVQTYQGAGSHGDVLGEPASHPGLPQLPSSRLVRGSGGDLISASGVIYAPMSLAGEFTLGSIVTPASGHPAPVVLLETPSVDGIMEYVRATLG